MNQEIIVSTEIKKQLSILCEKHGFKKILLVCDAAFSFLKTKEEYLNIDIPYVIFNEFTPNPLYEDVVKGVNCFKENKCDAILAIGGGSAIDVAKCIKLYSTMDDSKLYLEQEYLANDIVLIAIPTTSGTGSESTRYAVIYYEGKKQSVTHESIVPSYALLDYRNLTTLPEYQKKCTMMDAFCQSIESWWSVNATEESREYSQKALSMILDNMDAYMENTEDGNQNMLIAANYAGRAINITQTTAAHAMSYKITSLYKVPHGRAAFICLPYVWEYMWKCVESNDEMKTLRELFTSIAKTLNCTNVPEAIAFIHGLNDKYFKNDTVVFEMKDIALLAASVNPTRLKNNPIILSTETLTDLYSMIVKKYS